MSIIAAAVPIASSAAVFSSTTVSQSPATKGDSQVLQAGNPALLGPATTHAAVVSLSGDMRTASSGRKREVDDSFGSEKQSQDGGRSGSSQKKSGGAQKHL